MKKQKNSRHFNAHIDRALVIMSESPHGLCNALWRKFDHVDGICHMITGVSYRDIEQAYYLDELFKFRDDKRAIRLTLLELYRNYAVSL